MYYIFSMHLRYVSVIMPEKVPEKKRMILKEAGTLKGIASSFHPFLIIESSSLLLLLFNDSTIRD